MDYEHCPSLTAMFFNQAERLGDQPFLWAKEGGVYKSLSWSQTAHRIETLARGLRNLGIGMGDRVMLVSENRPEWLISDLAIMSCGGITVPAYTTNSAPDHLHILNNSGAKAVIVSTKSLCDRVLPAAWQAAHPPFVVTMEMPTLSQNIGVQLVPWDDAMALGAAAPDGIADIVRATRRDDIACVIYTSGTGGAPKGVMTSHGAIITNCMGAYHVLKQIGLGDDVFLCFLPLSHAYEHTAGQFFPISLGAQIYYAESLEKLASNLLEARPTIMTAVPRLYETLRLRILKTVERQGGLKAKLFRKALELGIKRYGNPKSLSLGERLYDKALDRLVRDKVRNRFGGRLKTMVSGGAPLNIDVGLFFTALGVRILQGYGQTEAAPVISVNLPGKVRLDTVGPPMKGVDVKIAEDGEILVRGEMVMQGYWGDPDASAAVIRDGRWLCTGDIGEFDENGFIRITDRKKDIIVNSGGDNISPQRIEGFLTLEPEIAQAMVYGDRRPHMVALIVPNPDFAASWAHSHGKTADLSDLAADLDFRKAIGAAIDRANRHLSPTEKVRRFIIAAEPFSVENEMMTPTLKIRRHKIRQIYGPQLEDLYEERRAKDLKVGEDRRSPEAE